MKKGKQSNKLGLAHEAKAKQCETATEFDDSHNPVVIDW